ncbi:hypothetical protein ACFYVL_01035 [Streptomyces sp. NPDC004111]|uniref:hypothetical protein n=1 Tax=Streptomyces sp. NPDC004111 TaxID=3364690 RepID=UPI00368C82E9
MGATARRTLAGGVFTLALALTGCGGGHREVTTIDVLRRTPTAEAPARTTAPPAGARAAHETAALTAYRAMWVERRKAYGKADAKGTGLAKYATDGALSRFRQDLADLRREHTVVRGEVGHDAKVALFDEHGTSPAVTVEDCVDLSKWQTLSRQTSRPVPSPSGQLRRYRVTATVEERPSGWTVTDYVPHETRAC